MVSSRIALVVAASLLQLELISSSAARRKMSASSFSRQKIAGVVQFIRQILELAIPYFFFFGDVECSRS